MAPYRVSVSVVLRIFIYATAIVTVLKPFEVQSTDTFIRILTSPTRVCLRMVRSFDMNLKLRVEEMEPGETVFSQR